MTVWSGTIKKQFEILQAQLASNLTDRFTFERNNTMSQIYKESFGASRYDSVSNGNGITADPTATLSKSVYIDSSHDEMESEGGLSYATVLKKRYKIKMFILYTGGYLFYTGGCLLHGQSSASQLQSRSKVRAAPPSAGYRRATQI